MDCDGADGKTCAQAPGGSWGPVLGPRKDGPLLDRGIFATEVRRAEKSREPASVHHVPVIAEKPPVGGSGFGAPVWGPPFWGPPVGGGESRPGFAFFGPMLGNKNLIKTDKSLGEAESRLRFRTDAHGD